MSPCPPDKKPCEGIIEIVADFGERDINKEKGSQGEEKYQRPFASFIGVGNGPNSNGKIYCHQNKRKIVIRSADEPDGRIFDASIESHNSN
jgi:hypothetical protein